MYALHVTQYSTIMNALKFTICSVYVEASQILISQDYMVITRRIDVGDYCQFRSSTCTASALEQNWHLFQLIYAQSISKRVLAANHFSGKIRP